MFDPRSWSVIVRRLTPAELRAIRCSQYLGYKPSGALKLIRRAESQLHRLPSWLFGPAFWLIVIITEFTPLGALARMDLLAERLYPGASDPR
jgi:hypothetical protein